MWKLGLLPDCFTYTTKYCIPCIPCICSSIVLTLTLFIAGFLVGLKELSQAHSFPLVSAPLPSPGLPWPFHFPCMAPVGGLGVLCVPPTSLLYCLRVTTVFPLWFPAGAEAWWMHILPFSVNRWCSCPAGSLPGRREWATCSRVAGLPGEGHVPGLLLGWGMIPELSGMQGCCWPEAGLLLLPLSEPSITPGPCLGRMSPASSLIPYRKNVVFQFSQVWGLPSFNQELGYDRSIFLLCCK